jgi:hypothetical protein
LEAEWRATKQLSSSQQKKIRSQQQYIWQTIQSEKESKEQSLQPGLPQCANEQTETVNTTQKSNNLNTQYKLFYVPVKIDNIFTYAFIDTVASVSAVSEYFFNRLRKDVKQNKINNNDNLRSICGDSMDILGVYKLNISLDHNAEIVEQKFYVVPQFTETCTLGIDFITENALVLDGETRRVNYKIKGRTYSLIADTGNSNYAYSPLIQLLNATVANPINKGEIIAVKVETPVSKVKIDDVNSEMYRNKIDKLLEFNKDVIADKLCELGQAKLKINTLYQSSTKQKIIY